MKIMKTGIFPCLWFDGEASEAAKLYCSILKNSAVTSETSMLVAFHLNGLKITALNGVPQYKINPSVSLFVTCETPEEVDQIWERLIVEGTALIPLDVYSWSKRYGWLSDKYGMTWQISWYGDERNEYRIIPCMLFTREHFGQAADAVRFYTSLFENSSTGVMVVYPDSDPNAGKIMYSEFVVNHTQISAMDGPGEHLFTFNEAVSFVVECDSQEEIEHLWTKLSEEGQEGMCGWVKDKFGVWWQIIPAILNAWMADPEKAPVVVKAFSQMRKFDIEALRHIFNEMDHSSLHSM